MDKFITVNFKMGETARKIKSSRYISTMVLNDAGKQAIAAAATAAHSIEIPLKFTTCDGKPRTTGIIQDIINNETCVVSLNEKAYEKFKNTDDYQVVAFFRNDTSLDSKKLKIARFEIIKANPKL